VLSVVGPSLLLAPLHLLPCDTTAALKELGRRLEDKLARAKVQLLLERRDFAFRLIPLE
jgi:hypothetical protein